MCFDSQCNTKCKRFTATVLDAFKESVNHVLNSEDILSAGNPLQQFAEAIMNFPRHYADDHSSDWCRFHPKVCVITINRSIKHTSVT